MWLINNCVWVARHCVKVYNNEDFNCTCAYSVINNVLKVALSSTHSVGEAVIHLSWLSSRSVGAFLLPI